MFIFSWLRNYLFFDIACSERPGGRNPVLVFQKGLEVLRANRRAANRRFATKAKLL